MDSKVAGQQPSQATRPSKHTGKQAKRDHEKGGNSRTVNGKETATSRCKAVKIHNLKLKEAQQKEKDLTTEVTKCRGELETMQSANDELEEKKASLEMQVTELNARLEARMNDLRKEKNEKFYLMKDLEEAKQTIEKEKASKAALRQMVDKLQDDKAKLEKNTSPLSMADMELEHKKALEQEQARKRKAIQDFEVKIATLQGELAENRRASEADRSELVAVKVQMQLAIKERDETAEEWRKRDQQVECQKKETDMLLKQLQDENTYLHGQLAENHRVEEMKRNELETAKRDCVTVELEKEAVEEKYLKSSNQVDSLTKELGETQRQLKELKKEYSACLKKLQMKHNSLQDDFQLKYRSLQASTDSSLDTAPAISDTADVIIALNHQLDADWREFGTFLYIKPSVMDRISKDKSKVSSCMLKLVEVWLYHEDQTGELPRTWGSVVMAVKYTGKGYLARQLAKCYGVQLPYGQ